MLTMRKISVIAATLVSALIVAGCSLATVAYNNAPTVLIYALNDYFDLTTEQEEWLKPRLNRFIEWHRATELPAYRRLLDDATRQVGEGARAEDARVLYENGRTRVARAGDRALPDLAAFLLQLEPRQIAHLEKKLAADNRQMAEEAAVPLATRQQKRVEKAVERYEEWFGSLSAAQAAKIRAAMAALSPLDAMRLADRKRRQAEFIALLKAAPELAVVKTEFRRMLLQPERGRDPAYQAEFDRQTEATVMLVMSLLAEATPGQRARVQKRLNGYAEDIGSLLRSG